MSAHNTHAAAPQLRRLHLADHLVELGLQFVVAFELVWRNDLNKRLALVQHAGDHIFAADLRRLIEARLLVITEAILFRDPQPHEA